MAACMETPSGEDRAAFGRKAARDKRLFIVEAMLSVNAQAMTGGVFLTSLLIYLGASDLHIGLLTSAGSSALIVSLLSSLVTEQVGNRKALLGCAALITRTLTALPVYVPMILGRGNPSLSVLTGMILAGVVVNTVSPTAFPIFFMDSVQAYGLSIRYIYTRGLFSKLASAVCTLAAGFLMEHLKSYSGPVAVFTAGLAFGILDSLTILRIHGPEATLHKKISFASFRMMLFDPIRDKRYRRFLLFSIGFFFFYLAGTSYISLYLKKYLSLNYLVITSYTTAISILMIFFSRFWGFVEVRIGALKVLVLTSVFMAADHLVYGFLTPTTLWLLPASVLLNSLGGSGFYICIQPYRYRLMPEEGKTIYEAWNGMIYASVCLLGSFAGGKAAVALPRVHLPSFSFGPYQVMFLICGAAEIVMALLFLRFASRDDRFGRESENEQIATGSAL